jgi:hypothetical protein
VNRRQISLRLLQVYSLFSATIAVLGGGTLVLAGIDGLPRVVGIEYSTLVPALQTATANIEPEIRVTFSTWYRSLGWYWFVTGLMLFWITPKVHLRTDWFRLIHVAFMAAGVATLVSIVEHGTNVHNRYVALVPEFGIPCGAMVWQWFVARSAERDEPV